LLWDKQIINRNGLIISRILRLFCLSEAYYYSIRAACSSSASTAETTTTVRSTMAGQTATTGRLPPTIVATHTTCISIVVTPMSTTTIRTTGTLSAVSLRSSRSAVPRCRSASLALREKTAEPSLALKRGSVICFLELDDRVQPIRFLCRASVRIRDKRDEQHAPCRRQWSLQPFCPWKRI